MKAKTLRVADGVDAEKVARELLKRKPQQARALVAVHRGHDTVDAVAKAIGCPYRNTHALVRSLEDSGHVVVAWPISETFEDIPTVIPTGKTVPVRGGSSTRTKGKR